MIEDADQMVEEADNQEKINIEIVNESEKVNQSIDDICSA